MICISIRWFRRVEWVFYWHSAKKKCRETKFKECERNEMLIKWLNRMVVTSIGENRVQTWNCYVMYGTINTYWRVVSIYLNAERVKHTLTRSHQLPIKTAFNYDYDYKFMFCGYCVILLYVSVSGFLHSKWYEMKGVYRRKSERMTRTKGESGGGREWKSGILTCCFWKLDWHIHR